jgi:hypothetical protein
MIFTRTFPLTAPAAQEQSLNSDRATARCACPCCPEIATYRSRRAQHARSRTGG